jgi:copper chaperone CopZ
MAKRMRQLGLILISMVMAAGLLAAEVRTERAEIRVKGVDCSACSRKVSTTLLKLDGVKSAEMNVETKLATVEFESGKVTRKQMVAAIRKAGYEVEKETKSR